jgi:glycosyltransferase involved in cell wall biosynthesis
MPRLLYLHPGLNPPPANPLLDKFFYISEVIEGDVLAPVWWRDEAEGKAKIGDRFPVAQAGRFFHHMYPIYGVRHGLWWAAKLAFYLQKGLELHRRHRFDYVMVYSTNIAGIAGALLKLITGAKLISELPNVPHHQYKYTEPRFTPVARVKKWAADALLHIAVWSADMVKLLYPTQLEHYPLLRNKRSIVFHDLVPVNYIATKTERDVALSNTVLLVGFPWYTKGADLAILAFKRIAAQFPDYRLLIVGHISDRTYLDQLAAGCNQIEIRKAVPGPEALKIISSCGVYLLASRTEGIARVLLEAMSAGRPIVASAVGGTPYCIQDEDNGLLFERGNVEQLSDKLSRILSQPELAARLGARAAQRVATDLDERAYVRQFRRMLELLN